MAQWNEVLSRDPEALASLMAWIDKRRGEIHQQVFGGKTPPPPEVVAGAWGAKKVLDELAQSATMISREEQADARYRRSVGT